MTYNWQFPNWAEFTYNDSVIDSLTTVFALETGEIKGGDSIYFQQCSRRYYFTAYDF